APAPREAPAVPGRRERRGHLVQRVEDRCGQANGRARGALRPAHVRRVRAAANDGSASGTRVLPQDAAGGALGRLGLPRAAHDRRPRATPAREARARSARARAHPYRSRRRVPLPRPVNPLRSVGARLSLALVGVVALALGLVYLIVVPSLRERLIDAKLAQLRAVVDSISKDVTTTEFDWQDQLQTWSSRAGDAPAVIYQLSSIASDRR